MLPTASPDGRRSLAGAALRPLRWAWDRVPHLLLAGSLVGGSGLLVLCGWGLAKTHPDPRPAPVVGAGEWEAFRRVAESDARHRWEAFEARCEVARVLEENAKLRARLGQGDRIPPQNLPVAPAEGAVPPPAAFGIQLEGRP